MKYGKLRYGIRDGKLVHISETQSGLSCDCICPVCDGSLIARKGEVNAWHFAHLDESGCKDAEKFILLSFCYEYMKSNIGKEVSFYLGEKKVSNFLAEWLKIDLMSKLPFGVANSITIANLKDYTIKVEEVFFEDFKTSPYVKIVGDGKELYIRAWIRPHRMNNKVEFKEDVSMAEDMVYITFFNDEVFLEKEEIFPKIEKKLSMGYFRWISESLSSSLAKACDSVIEDVANYKQFEPFITEYSFSTLGYYVSPILDERAREAERRRLEEENRIKNAEKLLAEEKARQEALNRVNKIFDSIIGSYFEDSTLDVSWVKGNSEVDTSSFGIGVNHLDSVRVSSCRREPERGILTFSSEIGDIIFFTNKGGIKDIDVLNCLYAIYTSEGKEYSVAFNKVVRNFNQAVKDIVEKRNFWSTYECPSRGLVCKDKCDKCTIPHIIYSKGFVNCLYGREEALIRKLKTISKRVGFPVYRKIFGQMYFQLY